MAADTPPRADNPAPAWKGAALALFSAFMFAMNTPLAALAYQDAVTPITLAAFRSLFAGLLAAAVVLWMREPGLRRLLARPAFWLATFGMAMQGMCYFASVAYIPVGLAAMILYTWPLLVAVFEPLIGGARLTLFRLCCFLGAFLGLALALGPDFESLDLHGIVLAFMGACCLPLYVLGSRLLLADTGLPLLIAGTNIGGAAIALAAAPLLGGLSFGTSGGAAVASLIVILIYAAGVLSQVAALRIFPASALAMLFNLEPVISIAAGAILLGETLTRSQYAGGAVVLTALALYSWSARKRPVG
ncbi:DMT family transporter [Hwanghaeella sp.]|uniref:DMT family transporter n=1 Tax=Hwanghaeella sp. TaxID=2605943 RepID=UPI003CCC00DC